MRYPRLLFAALTLLICLLLDFALSRMTASAPVAPALPTAAPDRLAPAPLTPPPNEFVPSVAPPSFKTPGKQGSLAPALTTPAKASVALTEENPFSEMPEPLVNKTGLVLLNFADARFLYPANRPITNASVWTSDERSLGPLGGPTNASHYAFSLYSARFFPVPPTSTLAVVCLDKTSTKGTP